jgi:hypothetical protein
MTTTPNNKRLHATRHEASRFPTRSTNAALLLRRSRKILTYHVGVQQQQPTSVSFRRGSYHPATCQPLDQADGFPHRRRRPGKRGSAAYGMRGVQRKVKYDTVRRRLTAWRRRRHGHRSFVRSFTGRERCQRCGRGLGAWNEDNIRPMPLRVSYINNCKDLLRSIV